MPFAFDQNQVCPNCPYGICVEDRRVNRVRNRDTQFRLKQNTALHCTFGEFAPGTDNDPNPARTFDEYLDQLRANTERAGVLHFGADFKIDSNALSKVEGDAFELIEAAALWNAFAAWNRFMETDAWTSKVFVAPPGTVAAPARRVAALKLPRGYNATKLFKDGVRRDILAFEAALKLQDMELGLSVPDIVGVRLPHPLPDDLRLFLEPLPDLSDPNRVLLEEVYQRFEGRLDSRSFLFAMAVKRTTRSDRLYQPLFEANVLKFLIQEVLRGAAFRFYVHMGSFEGANVEGRYKAASLISLMPGGAPRKAIDVTYRALRPAEAAQAVLNDLPLFPF